jgi:hypothetical protein
MRYLITPTLLNAWSYLHSVDDEWSESARTEFLSTLSRDKFEPTDAMKQGNKFEADVFAHVDGYRPELDDEYWKCVAEVASQVPGGARQLSVKREIVVDGQEFLLYGKVDHVAGPWATDVKWTGSYEFPKFKDTAQHPVYLACLPAVPSFRYLISDGRRVYEEVYQRGECATPEELVREFVSGLNKWPEALAEFKSKWVAF